MVCWDLIDIKPKSGNCSWSNRRVSDVFIVACLDRLLLQTNWLLNGLD